MRSIRFPVLLKLAELARSRSSVGPAPTAQHSPPAPNSPAFPVGGCREERKIWDPGKGSVYIPSINPPRKYASAVAKHIQSYGRPWTWPWLPQDWERRACWPSEPPECWRTRARPGDPKNGQVAANLTCCSLAQNPASAPQVGPEANGNWQQTPGPWSTRGLRWERGSRAGRGDILPVGRQRPFCWSWTSLRSGGLLKMSLLVPWRTLLTSLFPGAAECWQPSAFNYCFSFTVDHSAVGF